MGVVRLRDIHCNRCSYLVQNLGLSQVLQLAYQMGRLVLMQESQQGLNMVSLMVLHWQGSHLLQMVDLRQAPPMVCHIRLEMTSWGFLYCEGSHLVNMVDMRQDPPMLSHMRLDMESLRDIQWERINLVQMVELICAPPMVGHMGVQMTSLKALYWEHYWDNKLDILWGAPLEKFQAGMWYQWQFQMHQLTLLPQYDGGRSVVCPEWGQAGSWLWWNKSGHRYHKCFRTYQWNCCQE